jgi:hypothetical protein
VIQLNYVALDTNLFWAALFGWYVARGAGSLSLDHALSRGLADSALPLAKTIIGFSDWVTRYFGPVYQGLLRLWIGAALALAALSHGGAVSAGLSQELSQLPPVSTLVVSGGHRGALPWRHRHTGTGAVPRLFQHMGVACRG